MHQIVDPSGGFTGDLVGAIANSVVSHRHQQACQHHADPTKAKQWLRREDFREPAKSPHFAAAAEGTLPLGTHTTIPTAAPRAEMAKPCHIPGLAASLHAPTERHIRRLLMKFFLYLNSSRGAL
jgi:hypothetical protein